LNPSFLSRLSHTIFGAWNAGAFLVLSVSAWYLLRRQHQEFAWLSLRFGLGFAALSIAASIITGDASAREVANDQPTKLAAMEGVFPANQPEGLHLFGWVDMSAGKVYGVEIPHLLSLLTYHSLDAPVKGLESFPQKDWPPVQATFQCFHLMVGIGFALAGLVMAALFFWWRGTLLDQQWLLWLMVPSVLGPELAGEFGWMTNELGRQPWLVYRLLRTSEGVSHLAHPRDVWISIVLFALVYALLLALFLFLLNDKIQRGPVDLPLAPVEAGRRASA